VGVLGSEMGIVWARRLELRLLENLMAEEWLGLATVEYAE